MNEWLFAIIGLVIGALAAAAFFLARRGRGQTDLANAQTRASLLDKQLAGQIQEIERLRAELAEVNRKREQADRALAAEQERVAALTEAEQRLKETFLATGAQALRANTAQFLELAKKTFEGLMTEAKGDAEKRQQVIDALVKPIREALDKHATAVGEIEKKREVAYKGLEEQIRHIAASHEKLDQQTGRLVTALRRPEQRGRWGEMQLRNVVELAGMTQRCDFEEQVQTDDPSTRDRPDMTVHMPGGGVIVVDSKVALDAYLDAIQPDADRDVHLARHAGHVEAHYRNLTKKQYWEQFERTPKLVVMFMPLESALVAALEVKPDLHSDAMANHVLIATPTLLVALLRAIAYGWQQEDVAANARQISETGRELYSRLSTFVEHLAKVGKGLDTTSRAYNSALGSLERMILPSSRRLKELHATTDADIDAPNPVEIETRQVAAGELLPAREDGATPPPDRTLAD